ncbi:MAG: hypothetical protein M1831_005001 [Alyxoria varia]|nr:MAG: hypothetical protein M1831_005001 [Alyxoria varia]
MSTSGSTQPGALATANSRINNANDEDLGSRISNTLRQVGYTHETSRAGAPPLQQLPLRELTASDDAMEWFQTHEGHFKSMLDILGISHRHMRMRVRVPYNLEADRPLPLRDETIVIEAHPSSNINLAWIRFVGQAWTYLMNHGRKDTYVEILATQPTTFEGVSRLLELELNHPLIERWRKGLDKEIEKELTSSDALAEGLKELNVGRIRTGTNVQLNPPVIIAEVDPELNERHWAFEEMAANSLLNRRKAEMCRILDGYKRDIEELTLRVERNSWLS